MSSSDEAAVEITDVESAAVRIPAHKLAQGDFVFDVYGGRHEIARVRHTAKGVEFRRADQTSFERLSIDETITVVKRGK